jgi:RNA polymerase sigma factor (TIGR02999 family)
LRKTPHRATLISVNGESGGGETDTLLRSVYDELRRLAAFQLQRERPNHTLQATALVHEAYLRLAAQDKSKWSDRVHFIAMASEMMRRVLVDYARGHVREKRGSGIEKLSLSEAAELVGGRDVELLDLDRALDRLAEIDPRKAKMVELRYFGGLTTEEAAESIGISLATAERDWKFSRAFLIRELGN